MCVCVCELTMCRSSIISMAHVPRKKLFDVFHAVSFAKVIISLQSTGCILKYFPRWLTHRSVIRGINTTKMRHRFISTFPNAVKHSVCNIWNAMIHGDVIKWKHIPRLRPFVRGIQRSPVNSPHMYVFCSRMCIYGCIYACIYTYMTYIETYWVFTNHEYFSCYMMTSSNGNIFRVTGPLCGEFTGPGEFHAQRPVMRSFDVFFDLRLNKRLSKQPWGWWFETPSWSLWRQCNDKHDVLLCFYHWVGSIPGRIIAVSANVIFFLVPD